MYQAGGLKAAGYFVGSMPFVKRLHPGWHHFSRFPPSVTLSLPNDTPAPLAFNITVGFQLFYLL